MELLQATPNPVRLLNHSFCSGPIGFQRIFERRAIFANAVEKKIIEKPPRASAERTIGPLQKVIARERQHRMANSRPPPDVAGARG